MPPKDCTYDGGAQGKAAPPKNPTSEKAARLALDAVLGALQGLRDEQKARVLAAASTFFKI